MDLLARGHMLADVVAIMGKFFLHGLSSQQNKQFIFAIFAGRSKRKVARATMKCEAKTK